MATRRVNDPKQPRKRLPPARTSEGRENQLIALSFDAAEKMLLSDSPPAQVVTHFLKLGSSTEKLAQQFKAEEIKLLKIKADTFASQQNSEKLYAEAMDAFRAYSGKPSESDEDDDDY